MVSPSKCSIINAKVVEPLRGGTALKSGIGTDESRIEDGISTPPRVSLYVSACQESVSQLSILKQSLVSLIGS